MLDPWIIEEIRRREREEEHGHGRRLEIPLEQPGHRDRGEATSEEREERGVVVIDL